LLTTLRKQPPFGATKPANAVYHQGAELRRRMRTPTARQAGWSPAVCSCGEATCHQGEADPWDQRTPLKKGIWSKSGIDQVYLPLEIRQKMEEAPV